MDHGYTLERRGREFEIECVRGTEIQNLKVNSTSGLFDPDLVAPAYAAFGDVYHIEFVSESEFKVVGRYEAYNCGDDWSEDCIWLTDYQNWSVYAEGKIGETCVVRANGWFNNEPLFAIPPEVWSGTWQKGDVVQFKLSLGKFHLYLVENDQWGVGGVDKGGRTFYTEVNSEEIYYEAMYINHPDYGTSFSMYIERVAWRGVFTAGDVIQWGVPQRLARTGDCEHGIGPPYDRYRQEQRSCVTDRKDYQARNFSCPDGDLDMGTLVYPDYYASDIQVTCLPGEPPPDDVSCGCLDAEDGQWCDEMKETEPHYRWRLYDGCARGVQHVPDSFSMRQIVPVTDDRRKPPELQDGGLDLVTIVKHCGPWDEKVAWRGGPNNEYELVCYIGEGENEGDVEDFDDAHFELIDTPPEYI